MKRNLQMAKWMFLIGGLLWVTETIAELFGGYVEDFNNGFDFLSELTFGATYITLALGVWNLLKANSVGGRIGWLGKTSMGLIGLTAIMMPVKSATLVTAASLQGISAIYKVEPFTGPLFLGAVLLSTVGVILFGVYSLKKSILPVWLSLLFLISYIAVFFPMYGKLVTAAIFVAVSAVTHFKKDNVTSVANSSLTV